MNDERIGWRVVAATLVLAAVGIAVLWAGGVEFPVVVPPGIVILLIGAAVVGAVRRPWTGWVAAALGAFVLVGFIVAGLTGDGFDHLLGKDGALVALGQALEVIGVAAALITGVTWARSGARTSA